MGVKRKKAEPDVQVGGPGPLAIVSLIVFSIILLGALSAFLMVKLHPSGIGPKCLSDGVNPDPRCTTGAVYLTTKEQICAAGYIQHITPAHEMVIAQVMDDYGIPRSDRERYEVVALIDIGIGGKNEIGNLFPLQKDSIPGVGQKKAVDSWLRARLCDGNISIETAQSLAKDWTMLIPNATK